MATYMKAGNRYFVEINQGKLLTIEEMQARQNMYIEKKIPEDIYYVHEISEKVLQYFDGIDENGYIKGWNKEKYRAIMESLKRQCSIVVFDKDGFHEKEEPKQEEVHQEEAPHTEDTTRSESSKKETPFDFDIPEWVNRKNNGQKNQTTSGFKGVNNMGNYRGMHEAGRAADYTEEQAQRAYQNARRTSAPPRTHAAARNRENKEAVTKDFKKIWRRIVLSVLAVAITATMTIGAERGIERLTTNHNINKSETYISSLLVPESAKNVPTLVERNTHHTEDFQGYWFDNANIANEVLELPDPFFDVATYLVYEEMGEDRYNPYIHNFDLFIEYIGAKAQAEQNPTAFARCNGCKTFEEFLAKNGIASEKDYVRFMREKVNQQIDQIKQSALAHEFAVIDPITNEEVEAEEAAKKAAKEASDVTTGPVLGEETEEDLNVGGGPRK